MSLRMSWLGGSRARRISFWSMIAIRDTTGETYSGSDVNGDGVAWTSRRTRFGNGRANQGRQQRDHRSQRERGLQSQSVPEHSDYRREQ